MVSTSSIHSFFTSKARYCALVLLLCILGVGTTYAQLTGTKTIGGGGDYASLQAAIAALNASGVGTGGVAFNVPAGYTETFTAANAGLITATGTTGNPIVFQKSGTGVNPLITAYAIGTGPADYIIAISGGSYITFDGIDVQKNSPFVNSTQSVEYGYRIVNTASAGCKYNTIKNCTITLDHLYVSSSAMQFNTIGIYQYTPTAPTSTALTNSFNTYTGNTIAEAYRGVWLLNTGADAPSYDEGNVFNNNVIGGSFVGSIGLTAAVSTTAPYTLGFRADQQSNFSFYGNEVKNVQYYRTTSQSSFGVYLGYLTGTANIYNNTIHDVYNQYSSSGSTNLIYGLNIQGSASSTINVYNNFIYKINYAGSSAGTNIQTFGCALSGNCTVNFNFNSIYLSEATASAATVLHTSAITFNAVNNILKYGNLSSSRNLYCLYLAGGTLGTSNYNNFDAYATSGTYYTGYYGGAKSTLANWQTATSKDANSKQFATNFASTTNLHLGISVDDPNYHGTSISSPSITTDIDGDIRITPLIGADEVIFCITPTVYTVSSTGNLCNNDAELRLLGNQSGVTYELYKDNVLQSGSAQVGSGGDDPTWSLPSAGTYTIKTAALGGYCSVAMTGSVVVASITPSISTHPSAATQSVCKDETPTDLSVVASGSGTLSYQWYSNTTAANSGGTLIDGATYDNYTPSTATPGDLYYYCVVTNTCTSGSATLASSVSGKITVNPLTAITKQPLTRSGCGNAGLRVTATGTGLSYQWQYSADGSTGWTNVANATPANTTYTYPVIDSLKNTVPAGYSATGYYHCVISSSVCSSNVTSNVAQLIIGNAPTVAAITAPSALCENNYLNMVNPTYTPNGSTIISTSWQLRPAALYQDITLPYLMLTSYNGKSIRYKVTYSCDPSVTTNPSAYSNAVALTVNAQPVITTQPSTTPQTKCKDESASALSIVATAGSGAITGYQWYSSTDAVNSTSADDNTVGTSSNSYTPLTTTVGALYYYCVVSNTNGCSKTSAVSGLVTVYPIPSLSSTLTPNAICSENKFNYTAQSTTPGVTITSWSRAAVSGISQGANSGAGAIISETLTNTTTSPIEVTYAIDMTANGCNNTQEVKVMVNPIPPLYTVSAGGEYCEGTGGLEITLSGSTIGVSYQLVLGDDEDPVGDFVDGMGNSITFGAQTVEGVYRVIGFMGVCPRRMTGTAVIYILSIPDPLLNIYHN